MFLRYGIFFNWTYAALMFVMSFLTSSASASIGSCADFSGEWIGTCTSVESGDTWSEDFSIIQPDCQNITIYDEIFAIGEESSKIYRNQSGTAIGLGVKQIFWDEAQLQLTYLDKGEIIDSSHERWDNFIEFFINADGNLAMTYHWEEIFADSDSSPVDFQKENYSCVFIKK